MIYDQQQSLKYVEKDTPTPSPLLFKILTCAVSTNSHTRTHTPNAFTMDIRNYYINCLLVIVPLKTKLLNGGDCLCSEGFGFFLRKCSMYNFQQVTKVIVKWLITAIVRGTHVPLPSPYTYVYRDDRFFIIFMQLRMTCNQYCLPLYEPQKTPSQRM